MTAGQVVLEVAGLPGSGKSRALASFAAGLSDRRVPVCEPQRAVGPAVALLPRTGRKLVRAARTAAARPGLSLRVGHRIVRSGQPTVRDVVARTLQWQVGQDALACPSRAAAVSLVDEGLLQCLWSVGLRADVQPLLDLLDRRDGWRAPDLLVVVRTPVDVAAARLAGRRSRHSRTQQLPAAALLAELERGEELLDLLLAWWAERRPRLEVDGSSGVDVADVQRVVAQVLALAPPAVPPHGVR